VKEQTMKKTNEALMTDDRKDTIIHWRADDLLVKKLDEGKTLFGTRSEFIRRAVNAYSVAV
jgi:hypothetical protein